MDTPTQEPTSRSRLMVLTLGAIGVVYGDIGTSPLYAVKACFSTESHAHISAGNPEVLGILSLIFWSLTLIISIKYLAFIMRFDNRGEGGILALMELVSTRTHGIAKMTFIFAVGIFGAALLYGDGIITPAISVLSAVEGVLVAAPGVKRFILPATVAILFGLFIIQRRGTGRVGRIFGPYMVFWFALLSVLGLVSIIQTPHVLAAVNPYHAFYFLTHHDLRAFLVLGSVFLVVTGGETVYADMGHFGKSAIRRGWFLLVYPALLLNYFGQGALLLREGNMPSTVADPFFHLVPSWGVIPLVIVSTLATVIASQAVISGAFSLTWQALQLGYLPRMKVMHTSGEERGQIYIPFINWTLFAGCVVVVLMFGSSEALAGAYGIAVTATMVITSILGWYAMRRLFKWNVWVTTVLTAVFLSLEGAFFAANIIKVVDGGWFPLLLGAVIYLIMVTWHRGRDILRSAIETRNQTIGTIIKDDIDRFEIVPGTAMYMSGYVGTAPPALVSNLRYNRCRHETMILLTVAIKAVSHVLPENRIQVMSLEKNFYQVTLAYGFMDELDLMKDLLYLPEHDVPVDVTDAVFVLGHETVAVKAGAGMAKWRKELFAFMHRNSRTPARYFGIPVKRALEVGSHIEI